VWCRCRCGFRWVKVAVAEGVCRCKSRSGCRWVKVAVAEGVCVSVCVSVWGCVGVGVSVGVGSVVESEPHRAKLLVRAVMMFQLRSRVRLQAYMGSPCYKLK
jgi:hypothetical protein